MGRVGFFVFFLMVCRKCWPGGLRFADCDRTTRRQKARDEPLTFSTTLNRKHQPFSEANGRRERGGGGGSNDDDKIARKKKKNGQ